MGKYFRILGDDKKMSVLAPVQHKVENEKNAVTSSFICSREFEEGVSRVGKAETLDDIHLHQMTKRSILFLKTIHESKRIQK